VPLSTVGPRVAIVAKLPGDHPPQISPPDTIERPLVIHPSDSQPAWPRGQVAVAGGPVTCLTCGCRLTTDESSAAGVWTHFAPLGGRDARGCRVDCVDLAHDRSGRAILGVPA
jgi:hypothetical protein